VAEIAGAAEDVESVHKILEHLAANGRARRTPGSPADAHYTVDDR